MNYKTREGGASVTVFVPYDCNNNCPFCINKQEYQNCEGFSAEKICGSIERLHAITPRCDFVFTGGEPLAKPAVLQQMIDRVPEGHRIFINSTLPVQKCVAEEEVFAFLARNRHRISCLNISRHLVSYVEECDDALLARVRDMGIPLRVNCVLFEDYPAEKLPAFIERFRALSLPIQFRFDYTATTPENLYEKAGDRILENLMALCEFEYLDGCRMRCGYWFNYKGLTVSYHRTLQVSTVKEDGFDILYDVIVKQNGAIHSDWDGTVMDVEAYEQVVYEPYDLRVLERAGE